ncbi:hypothetical protein M427DRAFT_147919 [Gonapodya prolifera JEL478]|uniref:Uncharacterized protein n=1 Tax=Gonapodya prolifera (strain JEL478) TaxID=1344416 RepID=A0A139A4K6_GONPJ|nr:hypothetical protein M427DRAFT_147919 [Gonapodya prolifera JEL478]|eukprot:KXS11293.1 hypothetical protein M427DRAFT_147919 [Gonapodya prolifera JEL478]
MADLCDLETPVNRAVPLSNSSILYLTDNQERLINPDCINVVFLSYMRKTILPLVNPALLQTPIPTPSLSPERSVLSVAASTMKLNNSVNPPASNAGGLSSSTQTTLSNKDHAIQATVAPRSSAQQISAPSVGLGPAGRRGTLKNPDQISNPPPMKPPPAPTPESVLESLGINVADIVVDLATESGEVLDLVNRPPKEYANKYLNNRDTYIAVRAVAAETESDPPTYVPLLDGYEFKKITVRAHAPFRNTNAPGHLAASNRTKALAQSKKVTAGDSTAGGGMVSADGSSGDRESTPMTGANLGGERNHLKSAERKASTKVVKGA